MNQLYYGDNLDILREHIDAESVDLVYLDPPFNSQSVSRNVIPTYALQMRGHVIDPVEGRLPLHHVPGATLSSQLGHNDRLHALLPVRHIQSFLGL